MTPVVHDETCAFSEHGVAVAILANEVCYTPLIVLVNQFNLFIRTLRHGFETSVGLPSSNIFRI